MNDLLKGCTVDLEDGVGPDECVFDLKMIDDCIYATKLAREGKGRDQCMYWKPRSGPREPRNDMVICPNCTTQFHAISVDHNFEIESLRARISEIEQGDVLVEAGLLMVDVPEPGTDMAKVMRVNQIMRRKHDDDIKRIAELERERSTFDCRFAGKYWEASGSHCPLNEPCLRCQLENELARGIHSCHENCKRPICVLTRERDAAVARAERLEAAIRDALEQCFSHGGYGFDDVVRRNLEESLRAVLEGK